MRHVRPLADVNVKDAPNNVGCLGVPRSAVGTGIVTAMIVVIGISLFALSKGSIAWPLG